MTFAARWSGKCAGCGERFPVGAEVEFVDGSLVLVHDCGEAFSELMEIGRKQNNACPKCWTVHAGECL